MWPLPSIILLATALLLPAAPVIQAQEEILTPLSNQWNATIDPPGSLELIVEHVPYDINITLNFNGTDPLPDDAIYTVTISTSNPLTVQLSNYSLQFSAEDVYDGVSYSVVVVGQVIGYVHLNLALDGIGGEEESSSVIHPPYLVTVVRASNALDNTFTIIMTVLAIINTINMGCGLDLNIVKANILRPLGPVVGFISQFTFMPLFSFGLAMLLIEDKLQGFGLLVMGVCPGGIASNFWTLLLDGDVNLSITMTFISTIAALGMMPFWLWLLSGFFLDENSMVKVPFLDIALSLIFLTIPIGIGLLIRRCKPKVAEFISTKFIKPFSFCVILIMLGLGFYTLSHIFVLLEWRMLVAGLCVALAGFLFGGIFAWIMRLTRAQIVAVSMETALQNGSIAFILLKVSIPAPYSDIAALPPIAQILMGSCILWAMFAIHKLYTCCRDRSRNSKEVEGKIKKQRIVKSGGADKPLMSKTDLPENVNVRQQPLQFHGGEITSEFFWAKRSSLIVPNSPSADSPSSPV